MHHETSCRFKLTASFAKRDGQDNVIMLRKTEHNDLAFILDTENDADNRSFIGQWTFEQHRESLTDEDIIHLNIENKLGEKGTDFPFM